MAQQQIGLSDKQLRFITAACTDLPVEKRKIFLGRFAAYCKVRAACFIQTMTMSRAESDRRCGDCSNSSTSLPRNRNRAA